MIKPSRHPTKANQLAETERKRERAWLIQITIAALTALALACTSCGLNLAQQVRLTKLASVATADCLKVSKPCPDMVNGKEPVCDLARFRCGLALECARRAKAAQEAIQTLQQARASGMSTMDQTAAAAGLDAAAKTYCAAGGWN